MRSARHLAQRTEEARRLSTTQARGLLSQSEWDALCSQGAITIQGVTFAKKIGGKTVLSQGNEADLQALFAPQPADLSAIEQAAVMQLAQQLRRTG